MHVVTDRCIEALRRASDDPRVDAMHSNGSQLVTFPCKTDHCAAGLVSLGG